MKPILFNTEMVRFILDGYKTVTRRVIKPQPPPTSYVRHSRDLSKQWGWSFWSDSDVHTIKMPYCPGDILYVKETWKQAVCDPAGGGYALTDLYLYKADEPIDTKGMDVENRWHPSIYMPKIAARLFLRVTGVRVERLQDMTELDVTRDFCVLPEVMRTIGMKPLCSCLWNSLIKRADRPLYGWNANPWVWVIEFERISKEEALK